MNDKYTYTYINISYLSAILVVITESCQNHLSESIKLENIHHLNILRTIRYFIKDKTFLTFLE